MKNTHSKKLLDYCMSSTNVRLTSNPAVQFYFGDVYYLMNPMVSKSHSFVLYFNIFK